MVSRRAILQGAVGAATAATLSPSFAATTLDVTPVTGSLALLTGAGGNVLALTTSEGLVLVDSGAAEASAQLLETLGGLPGGAPVRTLFNTHWHLDQIGANERIGASGATIVAHEKTRLRLATGYYLPAEDRYEKPVAVQAQPTESFYTTGETTIGGQRIDYGY
jgi:glyoxylase-like metal-dependent hydrolase (beta-lactamase superfamily II)